MKAPKGTRDLFGPEVELFSHLETVARRVFSEYQFSELRTPLFESIDLFSRSLGETSDVVEKEMFTFTDRGEREFALRPEGTASVVRHFLENKLQVKGGVHRFFYMGAMFRAERPQAGRYRQFWQIGSEHFGDSGPSADADTIILICRILKSVGLKDFKVKINSLGDAEARKNHRKALLKYLETKKDKLSKESQERMNKNPLRVLDSKVDGPKIKDAPLIQDYLSTECQDHYKKVLELLKSENIPFEQDPRLVRGLDYYTRTVFEVISSDLGAQNAVAAGGRYDGLVAHLGGPSVPAVGFALGMDRVVSVIQKQGSSENGLPGKGSLAVVAPLVPEALTPSFSLANQLRKEGWQVPPVMVKKKLKNILSLAVEIGATWAILVGEDELAAQKATVKNLATREQSQVAFSDVLQHLHKN